MIFNVLEHEVRSVLDELIANGGYDGCTCDHCKNDIMALTLNQIKPHYSVTQTGEAYIKAKLMADQMKIDIFREMAIAIEKVKKINHHNRE